jgi:hypothetical protein
MTVKEAVIEARQELLNVRVPGAFLEDIGTHVARAIALLTATVEGIEKGEKAENANANAE